MKKEQCEMQRHSGTVCAPYWCLWYEFLPSSKIYIYIYFFEYQYSIYRLLQFIFPEDMNIHIWRYQEYSTK